MIYLDSSVALQAILETPDRQTLLSWFAANTEPLVSSRLLRTETIRILWREHRSASDADWLLARVNLVDITRQTHDLAESFTGNIRTLDALHVATALTLASPLLSGRLTLASHDQQMLAIAAAEGIDTIDPVVA